MTYRVMRTEVTVQAPENHQAIMTPQGEWLRPDQIRVLRSIAVDGYVHCVGVVRGPRYRKDGSLGTRWIGYFVVLEGRRIGRSDAVDMERLEHQSTELLRLMVNLGEQLKHTTLGDR